MKLTEIVTKKIVRKLLKGEDHRMEVIHLIDAEFLQFVVCFFKKVAAAKIANKRIDTDWYRKEMLSQDLPAKDIAINAGLNQKTITNIYHSETKEITIKASHEHYDALYQSIEELIKLEDLNVKLHICFNNASISLSSSESLIVINTLAVKRSALRGAFWSTTGKQTEYPLMLTLCKLFNVSSKNFSAKNDPKHAEEGSEGKTRRETDFFLLKGSKEFKCEVKLMGKGNPESADAAFARDSNILIADKLSDRNKVQLGESNIEWVKMSGNNGYKKFGRILKKLGIRHKTFSSKALDQKIKNIFEEIFG